MNGQEQGHEACISLTYGKSNESRSRLVRDPFLVGHEHIVLNTDSFSPLVLLFQVSGAERLEEPVSFGRDFTDNVVSFGISVT